MCHLCDIDWIGASDLKAIKSQEKSTVSHVDIQLSITATVTHMGNWDKIFLEEKGLFSLISFPQVYALERQCAITEADTPPSEWQN